MAWAKLDDAMPHHPKVMMAGAQAFALDVAAICYSNRFGCDGFIADGTLPAVLPCLSSPRRWANKLAEAGRWVRDDEAGGWHIHDIDDYQPSADDQEAERAAARERMRQLRAKRRGKPPSSGTVQANSSGSFGRTGGERSGEVRNPVPSRPEPPNGGSPHTPVDNSPPESVEDAWDRVQTYIRIYAAQDPDRPDPPGWMRDALRPLGGLGAVRRDEVSVFEFRRAWHGLG